MSILETFYILFKSDASDVKKGADEAEKSTRHLQDSLKNVDNTSKHVGESFLSMATSFASALGVAVSVAGIVAGIRSATQYTEELGRVSRELNVNVSELEAWGNAVERSGGKVTGFQSSLKNLAEKLHTSGAVALQFLPKLSESLSKMSQFQAFRYGKSLGLDESTILLLQRGRREVEELVKRQKELGTVNKEDVAAVRKFNEALHDVSIASQSFFRSLVSPAIPYFTNFINYFLEHKDLVVGGLIAIGAAAAVISAPFIAANAVAIALIAAIGSVIAIFAIAYEDIKAFYDGNESLTGDIIKRWPMVGQVIKTVLDSLKQTIDILMHPLESLQNLLSRVFDKIRGIFGQNKELTVNINEGRDGLNAASLANIQSFNTSRTQSSNRSSVVNTGPITVNTQATDANGVATGLGRGLNEQLAQVNSHVDDGVAY